MSTLDRYSAELLVRGYEDADREKVFEAARFLDCEVVIPLDTELQLDIDKKWKWKESLQKFPLHGLDGLEFSGINQKGLASLCKEISIMSAYGWKSRNGNIHINITLVSPFSDLERIVFQSILGSDPSRELLNWKRVKDGSKNPIALFRPLSTMGQ